MPVNSLRFFCSGIFCLRERDNMLDLAFLARCVELGVPVHSACHDVEVRNAVKAKLWVDLSQSISREPWKCGDMPVYHTNYRMYSYEHDCKLEPEEVLAVYGRDVRHPHHASEGEMRDLVGNCMAAQPLAAVLHAALFTISKHIPGLWQDAA